MKKIIFVFLIITLIFSFFINLKLENDYSLYSYNDYKAAVEYLNYNSEEKDFIF